MLQQLRIRHLAVVEDLSIRFEPGLNLLTGETGAGKSIIVESLNLLLGGKGSVDRIRAGKDSASVEAEFLLSDRQRERLESLGLAVSFDPDHRVFASRWFDTGGKSRAAWNGQAVTLSRLRQLVGALVTLHSQNSHQSLLLPGIYRDLLDRFAGHGRQLDELRNLYKKIRSLDKELSRLRGDPESLQARRDLLEFQVSEIRAAGPRLGEEDDLRRQREILRNAARILQACEGVDRNLDSEDGVVAHLHRLIADLEILASADPRFPEYRDRGRDLLFLLQELTREISSFRDGSDWRPDRLSELDDRLSRLHSLKSRYGGDLQAVLEFLGTAESEIEKLRDVEKTARDMEKARAVHTERFQNLAAGVSRTRREAAHRLESQLSRDLQKLAFPRGARVQILVGEKPLSGSPVKAAGEPVEFDAGGWDRVQFRIAANPGEPPRDLARIASGGELSRILLAIQCLCGVEQAPGSSLVFDEVDAGIGAEVAVVVGERLRNLGKAHQIICVTHWPQIAAGGDCHYLVRKMVSGGRTRVEVDRLSGEKRKREIARMLGGKVAPATSLRHAAELLETLSPQSGAR